MRRLLLAAALAVAFPATAHAKIVFAAYEGPDAMQTGPGGTKVDMRGIELWMTGGPPRRFQIIGFITDSRKDRLLDGDALDSPAIAKKAREVGGEALILNTQSERQVGTAMGGNLWSNGTSTFGSGNSVAVNRKTTQFIVIRYVE
ncbi:hypothetical protein [Sphingomonas baiyangensis]|uniref:Uncharacterized protein n=1 Tax=Sphingomonas baiyangensis TaxID=2572576 RepID=A0A4U1L2Y8_9SPHN|nr:hypothetical protein [Sphingomonas baiyangensis]TKD50553.1 hypothetical protein FBR43_07090 [Sphingomonas baiyangensis]